MTKQDFINYLSHPEQLDKYSLVVLEKLLREYPYFQAGRMLYLKNLHNENSIEYEKNLHITSAYVSGGKVLYNLIKHPPVKNEIINSPSAENRQVQPETAIIPRLEPIAILQEIPVHADQTGKDEFDELQQLEKDILQQAAKQASLTIDLLKSQPPAVNTTLPSSVKQPEINIRELIFSFNEWLKIMSRQDTGNTPSETFSWKEQKKQMIDDFILEEASKVTPKTKTEFYSAEKMAQKSLQDDETFVTETLATIYLKQGNLPKALRAYEILMVKHPEKIHIFAPLLEKIKKLLAQQQKGK